MDTQTTNSGDNQGTNSSDDKLGTGAMPVLPSLPKNNGVEPPADLPFVDDVSDDMPDEVKLIDEKPVKEIPAVLRPMPKIVPGVRGPLPTAPASPMKSSSAKFGIGTALKGSSISRDQKNIPEVLKKKEILVDTVKEESIIKEIAEVAPEKVIPDLRSPVAPMRQKIGVPRAPVAPESTVEKDIEELINKSGDNDDSKMSGKSVPPPTAPPEASVDRNIRPRRLAIVVIVLLLFIAVIFMSLWYFLTRNSGTATPPQPTDSSLFSPGPSTDVVAVSPTPSADTLSLTDTDEDGLTDAQEIKLGTDPFKADTDGDGYDDKQEIDAGYDPLVNGGKLDSDRDGLADPNEKCWGSDVNNPDTDGDGYLDGQEVVNGFDPLIASPNDKLSGPARCNI